jgi:hypothetical protein
LNNLIVNDIYILIPVGWSKMIGKHITVFELENCSMLMMHTGQTSIPVFFLQKDEHIVSF